MTETEKNEKKAAGSKMLGTVVKVVLGLVFLALGVYLLFFYKLGWWRYTWVLVKGCIGPFLVLAGLITLAIAKE
jgi:hypothetical protein